MDDKTQEQVGALLGSIANGLDILAGLMPIESKSVKARAIATLICQLKMEMDLPLISRAVGEVILEVDTPKIILPGQQ